MEQFPEWLFNSALSGHTTFLQRVKRHLKRPFAAQEAQMALIPAAQHGRTDYLIYLLENGTDPNVRSEYHQATPLHYAARLDSYTAFIHLITLRPLSTSFSHATCHDIGSVEKKHTLQNYS